MEHTSANFVLSYHPFYMDNIQHYTRFVCDIIITLPHRTIHYRTIRNQPIHPEIKQCKFNRGKIFPLLSLLCHFHSHNTVTDFHVFITVFVNLPAHQHMNAFVDINGQCITHAHPQSEMQYSKVHHLPTPLDRNNNLCQCQHKIINNNQP